jgi:hypothetical protein
MSIFCWFSQSSDLISAGLYICDPNMNQHSLDLEESSLPQLRMPVTTWHHTLSSTVKLPGFWPCSPEMWLHQVDCIFATKGRHILYCHTIASLQYKSLCLISDLMRALPADPYAMVKACVNTSYHITDY